MFEMKNESDGTATRKKNDVGLFTGINVKFGAI